MAARIVSGKQAKALLSMAEAIEVNAAAFVLHAAGSVLNPERLIVRGRGCLDWLRVIDCLPLMLLCPLSWAFATLLVPCKGIRS